MNPYQIAFIICSNDKQETDECLFYLRNLKIPRGYSTEIIPIYNASSMASGYNIGMNRSDAKYKVYLHQDTFIINPNFIHELLQVFQSDSEIGILGCVGRRKMPLDGLAVDGWNTGKVYDNLDSVQGYESGICEVDALDGLLLATQYDIPWREDLFQGWDYYDISQCYEFLRKGLKVVVPKQKEYWCYHDNRYSRLKDYDKWRQKFVEEYQDIYPFEYTEHISENKREMEELAKALTAMLASHLNSGQMTEFAAICSNPGVKNQLWAKEYCQVSSIFGTEQNTNSIKQIYRGNAKDTLDYLRRLKHLLKRIEYNAQIDDEVLSEIIENYSVYAICIVCISYCRKRKRVYETLLSFCRIHGKEQEERELFSFQEVMTEQQSIEVKHMQPLIVRDESWEKSGQEQVLLIVNSIARQTPKAFELCQKLRKQYDIFLVVQQYDADILEELDQMHIETFYLEQPMHMMWDMKDKLYKQFKEVIIVGDNMERFVEQWHRTHVPVKWYVSGEKVEGRREYSENILLYMA
ncbi:glycosyltransferase family protein [Roseburia sp. 499]|uniref:glycosyltransferase family protein n=1 Tax=Roseburia sp. 499 TaxID=1261634 RepID=UPI000951FF51|nr:glycosyltransferase family protein [Roseburia sp. 499]WVK70044.1 glycosyltransferase family protein [Roseburia sp. 499]